MEDYDSLPDFEPTNYHKKYGDDYMIANDASFRLF